jgi:8-oxo-dGTP diphosphatase
MVVDKDGKILALKRGIEKKQRSGKWDLPGGGYERGEEVINAIKREVIEETTLIIKNPKPLYVASGLNFSSEFMDGEVVFAVCYVCDSWQGEVKISHEHTKYQWVSPDEFSRLDFGKDGGFFTAAIKQYVEKSK